MQTYEREKEKMLVVYLCIYVFTKLNTEGQMDILYHVLDFSNIVIALVMISQSSGRIADYNMKQY